MEHGIHHRQYHTSHHYPSHAFNILTSELANPECRNTNVTIWNPSFQDASRTLKYHVKEDN